MAATLDAARPRRPAVPNSVATTLAAAGVAVAALALIGATTAGSDRPDLPVTLLHVAGGVLFLIAGMAASIQRPRNHTGLLMIAAGLAWFVTDLRYAAGSVGFTTADVLGVTYFAVIGHLALAFPSGRLTTARDRAVVAAAYIWTLVGNLLPEAFWAPQAGACGGCPVNLLVINRDPALHEAVGRLHQVGNIAVGVLVLAAVIAHRRAATPPARRALAPVVWASGPIIGILLALNLVGMVASPEWLAPALPALTPLALMSLPVSLLVGLIRGRLARLAVGPLVVELGAASGQEALGPMLARALGDPSLEVAYRAPAAADGWVDAGGRPVLLPRGEGRSVTLLDREGEVIAAVVHDPSLDDDAELVGSVAAAASLALENERLRADVLARLTEVRDSRARIVAAADAARRRLERDLHDGAQQSLLGLGLQLGVARDQAAEGHAAEAARTLDAAIEDLRRATAELRELAAGIHPPVLSEAGLGPALEALAERAVLPVRVAEVPARRLPDAAEGAAYFVASEALANVTKHSGARSATVRCSWADGVLRLVVEDDGQGGADPARGSGLRGLHDRVAAFDGRLSVESRPGAGTRVVAEIPCS